MPIDNLPKNEWCLFFTPFNTFLSPIVAMIKKNLSVMKIPETSPAFYPLKSVNLSAESILACVYCKKELIPLPKPKPDNSTCTDFCLSRLDLLGGSPF